MPLYEFLCLDCKKRSTVLVLSLAHQAPVACSHCASAQVERILSQFALADPSNLAGLDENDPQSMARFMKTMGEEMGEDLGDDLSEAMESDEAGPMESDGSDRL
jgi:putative FmdB family regulatory protein